MIQANFRWYVIMAYWPDYILVAAAFDCLMCAETYLEAVIKNHDDWELYDYTILEIE